MARLQAAHRTDGVHIWSAVAKMVNKQPRTANKGWPSSLVVGRGSNNYSP